MPKWQIIDPNGEFPFAGYSCGSANLIPHNSRAQTDLLGSALRFLLAQAQGALAVIFAAQAGPERPFGYHHDRTPPGGVNERWWPKVSFCKPQNSSLLTWLALGVIRFAFRPGIMT